jgi:hypothetical protein
MVSAVLCSSLQIQLTDRHISRFYNNLRVKLNRAPQIHKMPVNIVDGFRIAA